MEFTYHGETVQRFTLPSGEDVTLAPGMKENADLPSTIDRVRRMERQGLLRRVRRRKEKKPAAPPAAEPENQNGDS